MSQLWNRISFAVWIFPSNYGRNPKCKKEMHSCCKSSPSQSEAAYYVYYSAPSKTNGLNVSFCYYNANLFYIRYEISPHTNTHTRIAHSVQPIDNIKLITRQLILNYWYSSLDQTKFIALCFCAVHTYTVRLTCLRNPNLSISTFSNSVCMKRTPFSRLFANVVCNMGF